MDSESPVLKNMSSVVVSSRCGICMEVIKADEVFKNVRCMYVYEGHNIFCVACVSRHVAARVREDPGKVSCPEPRCRAFLDPQSSPQMAARLSEDVVLRWEIGMVAHIVRRLQINSCPFNDCRASLPKWEDILGLRKFKVECDGCGRELCERCLVPWHVGVTCKQYRKNIEKEKLKRISEGGAGVPENRVKHMDKQFKGLAGSMRWRRCPGCRHFVEKEDGCEHIQCRCRYEFCYDCGREWNWGHKCPFIYWRSRLRRYRYRITQLFSSCKCTN